MYIPIYSDNKCDDDYDDINTCNDDDDDTDDNDNVDKDDDDVSLSYLSSRIYLPDLSFASPVVSSPFQISLRLLLNSQ